MSNIRQFPAPRVLPTEQPFRIRWGSDLVDSRPVSWLVEDMIPRGTVSLLAGEPFLGKTWICQSLMIAHGLGVPWYGRDVGRGRAYALFAEDIDERVLIPRRDNILAMYGADRHALDEGAVSWSAPTVKHPDFDPLLFQTQRFKQGGTPTDLWRQILDHGSEIGVDLYVFDNATTCLDSVDPDHVKAFLRMLMQAAVERDAAVLLLHHPPKDGSAPYAGTALWARLCRNILVLQRSTKETEEVSDDGRRVLRLYQSNWTGARPKIWLRWQEGCLVEDEAPDPTGKNSPAKQRSYPMSQAEKQDFRYRVLIAMKTIVDRGGVIYADMAHPKSMPARARRQAGWQLYSPEQIDDAVDELVKVGQAERVTVGSTVIVRPNS